MICNHLYPLTEIIYDSNRYWSIQLSEGVYLASLFSGFGKICVAIFAFLSGIGLYHQYTYKSNAYVLSLKNLLRVWSVYWKVLIVLFIPLAFFCVDTIDMNWQFVLDNLVGYDTTLVKSAWYLLVYTEIIVTFPLFWKWFTIEIDKKYSGLAISFGVVVLIVFEFIVPVKHLAHFIQYMLIVIFLGVFAKYRILDKCINQMLSLTIIMRSIVCVLLLFGSILGRGIVKYFWIIPSDIIWVPIIVILCTTIILSIDNIKLNLCLKKIAEKSTFIWFFHTVFFIGNESIQKIIYWPKIDILILMWTLILSCSIAGIWDATEKAIKCVFNKVIDSSK